jgi:phosphoribosylglycinamide formyltransferase-1
MRLMRLGFLASNNGSGMRAVVGAIEAGELDAKACVVISNRRDAPALAFARDHGVEARFIPTVPDADAADRRLAEALTDARVDWVLLAGYLRKLGPITLAAFRDRILNIHPSLLPKFGGQGMYGRRVHEAVIAAGDTVSGASVHLVDEEYDHGAVLAQARVAVLPSDTAELLERRVMAAEPGLYVDLLKRIRTERIILSISDNIS